MGNSRNLANLLGTGSTIATAKIADDVFNANRNLVINGAMQVAQRGTSSTGFVASAAYLTVDRFKCENGSSGTFTVSQATDAPAGFANSLKFDCTTADSSPDYFLIVHRFEGQNLQHLEKGTSASKKTTLSFHVKSNKTGTYQVNLRDIDNSRIIGKTYAISAADTWEKKTVTFDGDTSGVLGNDTGNSMQLEWWLGSGSTYNSGAVPTAWEAIANGDRAAGLNVHIGASTDDEFYITGVQLEVGEQATPFEHRSYGDELLKCQRYFIRVPVENNFEAHPMWIYTTNAASTRIPLGLVMRAAPTVAIEGSTSSGTDWDIYYSGAFRTPNSIVAANITSDSFRLNVSASGLTSGGAAGFYSRSADAGLTADAEL